MFQKVKKYEEVDLGNFLSDARILINFLSITGIPNIDESKTDTAIYLLKKIALYFLALYLLCMAVFISVYRIDRYFLDDNVLWLLTASSSVILFLLLKLLVVVKIKKLIASLHSMYRFIQRCQLKSYSSLKIIIILGCTVSLIIPLIVSFVQRKKQDPLQHWIRDHCSLTKKSASYIVAVLRIGQAINDFSFPVILAILLAFFYVSFSKLLLKAFSEQLLLTHKHPTSSNIKLSLEMYSSVIKVWSQIEAETSSIAFLLYGLSFSTSLYILCKHISSGNVTFVVKFLFCLVQMILLSFSGSDTVEKWKEIRFLAQETAQLHCAYHEDIQNKDILLLLSLMEGTNMDLSFTCFGIQKIDFSLLTTTIFMLATLSVILK